MDLSTHAAANFWFPTQTSEAEGPYYTTPPVDQFLLEVCYKILGYQHQIKVTQ